LDSVVDRRSVANPVQARTLLNAAREQRRSGPRLVAFFGCLYFAALRPEEAVSLAKHNLSLPTEGWGELYLESAEQYAGKEWTDSGDNRDRRQLKQRARGRGPDGALPAGVDRAPARAHPAVRHRTGRTPLFGERNAAGLPKLTIVRA
jgi:hypothetical protein